MNVRFSRFRGHGKGERLVHAGVCADDVVLSVFDQDYGLQITRRAYAWRETLGGEALRRSLRRVIARLPLLAGRLVVGRDGGHRIVCADQGASWTEVFVDGALPALAPHRSGAEQLGAWAGAGTARVSGDEPLVRIRVTHFSEGGTIIGLAAPHALADAGSVSRLMSLWASVHRDEPCQFPSVDRRRLIEFEREAAGGLSRSRAQLARAALRNAKFVGRILANAQALESRVFELDEDDLRPVYEAGATRLAHDLIGAHLWRTLTATSEQPELELTGVINLRSRLASLIDVGLFGNAVGHARCVLPREQVHGGELEALAERIRDVRRRATPAQARLDHAERCREWKRGTGLLLRDHTTAVALRGGVCFNSEVGSPLYDVDFGSGRPCWIVRPNFPIPAFVLWSPSAKPGVVHMRLSLPRERMAWLESPAGQRALAPGRAARVTRSVPNADRLPVLGSLPQLLRAPFTVFDESQRRFGPVFEVGLGPVSAHLVTSPAGAQAVLVEHGDIFIRGGTFYASVAPLFGESLPMAVGSGWRRRRRCVGPFLSAEAIFNLRPLIVDEIDRCMETIWGQGGDGEPCDVHDLAAQTAMQVALTVLFGVETRELEPLRDALTRVLRRVAPAVITRALPSWIPTPILLGERQALAQIHSVIQALIEGRRRSPGKDLLSRLVHDTPEDPFSDEELRDEVMGLLFASYDTTSNAIAWTLQLLATHPEELARVRAESGIAAERAVKEALRLYPSAPLIPRVATQTTVVAGVEIPAGANVFVSVWNIHRDPELWPEPARFDPARFVDDPPRGRWLPFGIGRHVCVGMTFALFEAQQTVAEVVRRFDLEPVPGREPRPRITLNMAPKHGIWLRLKARARAETD